MENLDMLISWMYEAIRNIPSSLFDPKYRGILFAVFILVILYSIVSSINRLKRHVSTASSELSAIRSTLKNIELSLGGVESKTSSSGKEEKDIWSIAFREDHDKPG